MTSAQAKKLADWFHLEAVGTFKLDLPPVPSYPTALDAFRLAVHCVVADENHMHFLAELMTEKADDLHHSQYPDEEYAEDQLFIGLVGKATELKRHPEDRGQWPNGWTEADNAILALATMAP